MTELDNIVRRSLCLFTLAINERQWTGRREREAINLYMLGHLQREVRPGSLLFDARQIGAEMPVKQIPPEKQLAISGRSGKPKADVTKDLLIWPEPEMTTWTREGISFHSPLAIQEWKMGSVAPYEADVLWLEEYSRDLPNFVGYAVFLRRGKAGEFSLSVARVKQGIRELNWLVCGG